MINVVNYPRGIRRAIPIKCKTIICASTLLSSLCRERSVLLICPLLYRRSYNKDMRSAYIRCLGAIQTARKASNAYCYELQIGLNWTKNDKLFSLEKRIRTRWHGKYGLSQNNWNNQLYPQCSTDFDIHHWQRFGVDCHIENFFAPFSTVHSLLV